MSESALDAGEFQRLIGAIMKERYIHEQRVADNDLSRHRQRTERSRSASRTPERHRSVSNTRLGSRVTSQKNSDVPTGGRPPRILSQEQTSVPVTGDEEEQQQQKKKNGWSEHNGAASGVLAQRGTPLNGNSESVGAAASPTGSTRSRISSSINRGNKESVREPHENCTSVITASEGEGEEDRRDVAMVSPRQRAIIQSPTPDDQCYLPQKYGVVDEQCSQPHQTQVACPQCVVLEAKVREMQATLAELISNVLQLSAKQKASERIAMSDEAESELPENPEELGSTTEEKFITVVTALARRVRRLEVDLESSLEQVRVMEAAAIERDIKLNHTKVGHDELNEAVANALLRGNNAEYANELRNLYRIWDLDPKRVQQALDSADPASCRDLLLSTPLFARVSGTAVKSSTDMLDMLHEEQLLHGVDETLYTPQVPSPSWHSSSQRARQKFLPLHELLLGIYLQDEKDLRGVRVTSVPAGSTAAHAVRPGDVIVQINRITVRSIADVSYVLSRARSHVPIALSVQVLDSPFVEVAQVLPLEIS
ncbi:hypothetical protein DQ04_00601160 [Trypanosoma grayi]|uniref:hypothetical protein n=1 Tax=Trypanosoma grayi TaxID=71804 RepID=UPI0004F41D32|nr:hypothetical protein DQ04_00601160 [Trypanosoma grayi]KEG14149.1 hypothetical protein DQ04_00601160 [Trypanosoma grayi]